MPARQRSAADIARIKSAGRRSRPAFSRLNGSRDGMSAEAEYRAGDSMATSAFSPTLSDNGALVERHWQELNLRRRTYSVIGLVLLAMALSGSLWFANATNAGKF